MTYSKQQMMEIRGAAKNLANNIVLNNSNLSEMDVERIANFMDESYEHSVMMVYYLEELCDVNGREFEDILKFIVDKTNNIEILRSISISFFWKIKNLR